MKIAFLGTPEISAIVISDLIENGVKIDSIITRPDKPKGRSNKLITSPVKDIATKNNIGVYQPKSKEELTETIKEINPDICIVAAYGMIIPNEALDVPRFGMINFHPSLLPLYRGPSPITEPILNGDKETGVTIIQVAEAMDAGDILAQEKIKLNGTETTPELSKNLAHLGSEMITKLLPKIESGETDTQKQDGSKATYMKMIKKEEGKIDWEKMTAEKIEKMSRAFVPWPGVYAFWNNKKIDLFDIQIVDGEFSPGKVYQEEGKIIIGAKKNGISPGLVRIEGKNKVTTEEFVRGYQKLLESRLS